MLRICLLVVWWFSSVVQSQFGFPFTCLYTNVESSHSDVSFEYSGIYQLNTSVPKFGSYFWQSLVHRKVSILIFDEHWYFYNSDSSAPKYENLDWEIDIFDNFSDSFPPNNEFWYNLNSGASMPLKFICYDELNSTVTDLIESQQTTTTSTTTTTTAPLSTTQSAEELTFNNTILKFGYCPNVVYSALVSTYDETSNAIWDVPIVAPFINNVTLTVSHNFGNDFTNGKKIITYVASSQGISYTAICQITLYVIDNVPISKMDECSGYSSGNIGLISLLVDSGNYSYIDDNQYSYTSLSSSIQTQYITSLLSDNDITCYIDLHFAQQGSKYSDKIHLGDMLWKILIGLTLLLVVLLGFERIYFHLCVRKYQRLSMEPLDEDEIDSIMMSQDMMADDIDDIPRRDSLMHTTPLPNALAAPINPFIAGNSISSNDASRRDSNVWLPPPPNDTGSNTSIPRLPSHRRSHSSTDMSHASPVQSPIYPLQQLSPAQLRQKQQQQQQQQRRRKRQYSMPVVPSVIHPHQPLRSGAMPPIYQNQSSMNPPMTNFLAPPMHSGAATAAADTLASHRIKQRTQSMPSQQIMAQMNPYLTGGDSNGSAEFWRRELIVLHAGGFEDGNRNLALLQKTTVRDLNGIVNKERTQTLVLRQLQREAEGVLQRIQTTQARRQSKAKLEQVQQSMLEEEWEQAGDEVSVSDMGRRQTLPIAGGGGSAGSGDVSGSGSGSRPLPSQTSQSSVSELSMDVVGQSSISQAQTQPLESLPLIVDDNRNLNEMTVEIRDDSEDDDDTRDIE